jgi:hypothetical protein
MDQREGVQGEIAPTRAKASETAGLKRPPLHREREKNVDQDQQRISEHTKEEDGRTRFGRKPKRCSTKPREHMSMSFTSVDKAPGLPVEAVED